MQISGMTRCYRVSEKRFIPAQVGECGDCGARFDIAVSPRTLFLESGTGCGSRG
jgi:hypothetical protein